MAISFELNAESRTDTGKGASRRLRRAGKVPAILYGGGKDPESLTLSHNEILRNLAYEAFYSHILSVKVGGNTTRAILRDLQRHPGKPTIMHVDLQRIIESEKLRTHVPLHFVGEDVAPGVKAGGLVSHELTEVLIECLPSDLPEYVEANLSGLDIGDSIHLSDLKLPEGAVLPELARGEGHDLAVVLIHAKRVVEEVEAAPVAAAGGEVAAGAGKETGESGAEE
ncbi:MAG: 50S ribosomal protein L25/general stress protein Ctc [Gammaproteobacteria bacterium]|jgi:large subunit ribosomal protein L25